MEFRLREGLGETLFLKKLKLKVSYLLLCILGQPASYIATGIATILYV